MRKKFIRRREHVVGNSLAPYLYMCHCSYGDVLRVGLPGSSVWHNDSGRIPPTFVLDTGVGTLAPNVRSSDVALMSAVLMFPFYRICAMKDYLEFAAFR